MPLDEIFHTQMSVPPLPGARRKNTLQVRSTTEVIWRWKAANDSAVEQAAFECAQPTRRP